MPKTCSFFSLLSIHWSSSRNKLLVIFNVRFISFLCLWVVLLWIGCHYTLVVAYNMLITCEVCYGRGTVAFFVQVVSVDSDDSLFLLFMLYFGRLAAYTIGVRNLRCNAFVDVIVVAVRLIPQYKKMCGLSMKI